VSQRVCEARNRSLPPRENSAKMHAYRLDIFHSMLLSRTCKHDREIRQVVLGRCRYTRDSGRTHVQQGPHRHGCSKGTSRRNILMVSNGGCFLLHASGGALVFVRVRWCRVGPKINRDPIRVGLPSACTPVVTLTWAGRSFRVCDARGSGRLVVRIIVIRQSSRVYGRGRGRLRGRSPVGEREICFGRSDRRHVVDWGTSTGGSWPELRLVYLIIRERIVHGLVPIVDNDPGVGPGQARILGLIQDIVPSIVALGGEPGSRTSDLHVPRRLFVRRAKRGVPLPPVLPFGRSSRIARIGAREWVIGK
jgi:hypothetical protein